VFDAEQSDDLALEGVRSNGFPMRLTKGHPLGRDLYGVLEARGQDPVHARWPRSTPPSPPTAS
jgi:Fe-S cluster assembly protein SufD